MRWITSFALLVVASMAFAQAPFTIVRPADGAKVREKVRVLIPRNSIPPTGYIGVFLNGRFSEAVRPDQGGKFYEYVLDTKGREIPDGPTKIEMVLYVDYNDQPKIVDRSSINVVVANKANIPVPTNGLTLRYRFHTGTETVYKLFERFSQSQVTDTQSRRGSRGSESGADLQSYRFAYAVDNSYTNGDGLLRMQALPPVGTKKVFLQSVENPSGRFYNDTEFGEMYMRLSNTGRQIFGSVPPSFTMEGIGPSPRMVDYYLLKTLPTLPAKTVRPGDIWQTNFQIAAIDQGNVHSANNLVIPIPARGEFDGVEWEMGRPCAKIHQTSLPAVEVAGHRVTVDETYWFALDKKEIVKIVRREMHDFPAAAPAPTPAVSGGGAPVTPGGPPPGATGVPFIPGRSGGRGGGAARGGVTFDSPPESLQQGATGQRRQARPGPQPTTTPVQNRVTASPVPQFTPTRPVVAGIPGVVLQRYTIEDTFVLSS